MASINCESVLQATSGEVWSYASRGVVELYARVRFQERESLSLECLLIKLDVTLQTPNKHHPVRAARTKHHIFYIINLSRDTIHSHLSMASPPPSATPAAAPATNVTALAMKCLMQAKIACANTVHDLETMDGITDDWHEGSESLLLTALDIHLHCEAASKECHAIIDALDACLQGTMREAQLGFVEMVCLFYGTLL